jgi:hypothetical protein
MEAMTAISLIKKMPGHFSESHEHWNKTVLFPLQISTCTKMLEWTAACGIFVQSFLWEMRA